MKRTLRSKFRDYEILDCFEACAATSVKQFINSETALIFLRTFQDDYFAISALRDIVAESYCCSNARNLSDHRVLEIVASGLAEGRLKIAGESRRRPTGGAAKRREPSRREEEEPPPARQPEIPVEMPQLALTCEIEETPQIELTVEIK